MIKKTVDGEMSERQAERLLEMYENACKNGEEWMHDVLLNRGTGKYQASIDRLNEAFRIKSINTIVQPLAQRT
jgi:myo-inositol catabolism protein IolC